MRVIILALMIGCGGKGNNGGRTIDTGYTGPYFSSTTGADRVTTTDSTTGLITTTYSAASSSDAQLRVEVEVDENTASFMVTGDSNKVVFLEEVTSPSGQLVFDWRDWLGDSSLTTAVFGDSVTTVNWPIRTSDGPLTPGTWSVLFTTGGPNYNLMGGVDVGVTIQTKPDNDLNAGIIRAALVYADGTSDDPAVVAAAEQAVAGWKQIWGEVGVVLEETWYESTLDPALSFAETGSDDVREISAIGELTLIIGDDIEGDLDYFGVSAGLPGTMTTTNKSFVVVSVLAHAGVNGTLEAEEIDIMAETMAHEAGHYMGLFHPVENTYDAWDAIADTPECGGAVACDDALGTNLMYPYPVCDYTSCVRQRDVSTAQSGVWHNYVGTL